MNKIWYGTFHRYEDILRPSGWPVLFWFMLLAVFVIVRLRLPFISTSSLEVHEAVVESLMRGQIWGRQALVGSPEFPLLTTLTLFAARNAGGWTGLPPGRMVVVLAQALTLYYLLRIPGQKRMGLGMGLVVFPLAAFSAEARRLFFSIDPNWVTAVPVAAGWYHFKLWSRDRSLRDLVLVGVNCGILVCAGPAGILVALVMSGMVSFKTTVIGGGENLSAEDRKGFNLLVWAPFGYFLSLLFVVNWLIMENPLFFLRRLLHNLTLLRDFNPGKEGLQSLNQLAWFIVGGFFMALMRLRDLRFRFCAVTVAVCLFSLFVMQMVMSGISYYTPAGEVVLLLLGAIGLTIPLWCPVSLPVIEADGEKWWRVGELTVLMLVLGLSITAPRKGMLGMELYDPPPPAVPEVLAEIDHYTPQTRVMVHGMQGPARFSDLKEERFVARLDFDVETIFSYRRQEDFFYLLVAPDNGKFYSPGNPLADIHRQGRSWLVLQKKWPDEWQLWMVLYSQTSGDEM